MKDLMKPKVIFVDTLLNVGLLLLCIIENTHNIQEEPGKIMVLMIYGCILGIFVIADIMYWIFHWQKKPSSIVYEMARYSIYIKIVTIVFVGIVNVILPFIN